jgi:P27 family predicted phage terminase small subunit
LEPLGLLTHVDRAALAIYCAAWARWNEAQAKCAELGETIETKIGNLIQNPWRGVAARAEATMVKVAQEFGMTPASRTRIEADPIKDPILSRAESYFAPRAARPN